jgi:hypothetical protein
MLSFYRPSESIHLRNIEFCYSGGRDRRIVNFPRPAGEKLARPYVRNKIYIKKKK